MKNILLLLIFFMNFTISIYCQESKFIEIVNYLEHDTTALKAYSRILNYPKKIEISVDDTLRRIESEDFRYELFAEKLNITIKEVKNLGTSILNEFRNQCVDRDVNYKKYFLPELHQFPINKKANFILSFSIYDTNILLAHLRLKNHASKGLCYIFFFDKYDKIIKVYNIEYEN